LKKFVKELVTNRFGIVMATLNICYFISTKPIQFIFSHQHLENCFYYREPFLLTFSRSEIANPVLAVDIPSFVLLSFPGDAFLKAFPDLCVFTQLHIQVIFFAFFVTLQWLFIGWIAKKLAKKINESV
jgi:hypothetical protein